MGQQLKWVLSMALLTAALFAYPEWSSAETKSTSFVHVPYQVKQGDTFYSIAKNYYLTGDYGQVAEANGWNLKAGLKAGSVLTLNDPLILDQYTVQPGDTLYGIAKKYYSRDQYMQTLAARNGLSDSGMDLKSGMALIVPLPTGEVRHTVQNGETLYGLSVQYYKLAEVVQSIANANGLADTPDQLVAGDKIRIPNAYGAEEKEAALESHAKKGIHIEISLSHNALYVLSGDRVTKSFAIASGKSAGLTPRGSFEIVTKIKNPWYSTKGIPGGDPANPLGSRWLGLDVGTTGGTKYGIHGTNAPESIGKYASAGCIRMQNKDVNWLYDKVPTGTRVDIVA